MHLGNLITIQSALNGADAETTAPAIAAFLLLAAVWHRRTVTERLIPVWQLETTGFTSWRRQENAGDNRIKAPESLFIYDTVGGSCVETAPASDLHAQLMVAIGAAMRSGTRDDAANAVAIASTHTDRLVRLSAHISALEMFRLGQRELDHLHSWLPAEDDQQLASKLASQDSERSFLENQLEAILRRRLSRERKSQLENGTSHNATAFGRAPGLILIHGTNLWWHSPPQWSVPGSPLFHFIRTWLRSDVYSGSDYYQWEGNYNDYGREVAAHNLVQWMAAKNLQGVDAVTHSHGGNVLMRATKFGGTFGHVLLLSCPVRRNYAFHEGAAISARSLRTCFDLVILADRAGQRFPPRSGIVEKYLPSWYGHSGTTNPKVWNQYGIRV